MAGGAKTVYVAGKWADSQSIREKIEQVKTIGFRIGHDWTTEDTKTCSEDAANNDIIGVVKASTFVAIMDDASYPYKGTNCELGAALALNRRIFVVGMPDELRNSNVFYKHHAIQHVATWDEVIEKLRALWDDIRVEERVAERERNRVCLFPDPTGNNYRGNRTLHPDIIMYPV